jgi:hypothetical protein
MKDINEGFNLPFKIKIGFKILLDSYNKTALSAYQKSRKEQLDSLVEKYPKLIEGFSNIIDLEDLNEPIQFILEDVFSEVLTYNEIKTASVIFHSRIFKSSKRFDNLVKNAGSHFNLNIVNLPENDQYIISCAIILNEFYGYKVNFKRPFYYEIPDKNGLIRTYKILYNADFVIFKKTKAAPEISRLDYEHLIDNFNNLELWKEKFPPNSYEFYGFVIANMVDVTEDQAISNIKASLIANNKQEKHNFITNFQEVFRSLLNVSDLQVGFSIFNKEESSLVKVYDATINSFLLQKNDSKSCTSLFCSHSFHSLIKNKNYYSISNITDAFKESNGNSPQISILHKQGIQSAIFAPISQNGQLLGILELISKEPFELNSFKAYKLEDVMPYIRLAVQRSQDDEQNLIQAIIQKECTSIHPSVQWKFENAARQYMFDMQHNASNVTFKKIKFKDVYPLFGQSDIVSSSKHRNETTKKDMLLQLKLTNQVISDILQNHPKSKVKELVKPLIKLENELKQEIQVNSERDFQVFFKDVVHPVFKIEAKEHLHNTKILDDYSKKIDLDLGMIYYYRKNFDDSVMTINDDIANIIDTRQFSAQKAYPHYFDRYKTDGVEHNMYMGEAITKEDSFEIDHLYHLRLWQLQVICEIESTVYHKKKHYPLKLDIASMILVFSQPISINFRFDEKQFDVDGSYNASYEVVKKRIDKACIKGTEERVTTAGKIAIMYSQDDDGKEYEAYVKFLQAKKLLKDDLELLELEILQGISGLKALRVGINYTENKTVDYYTYQDMKDIKK